MTSIAERFVEIFGNDAPPVPQSKADFQTLDLTKQQVLMQRLPEFCQGFLAAPESLPAAVAVRYEKGTLEIGDVAALRKAGLYMEAEKLIEGEGLRQLDRLKDELTALRATRNLPIEHQRAAAAKDAEVRRLSRAGYTGRVS